MIGLYLYSTFWHHNSNPRPLKNKNTCFLRIVKFLSLCSQQEKQSMEMLCLVVNMRTDIYIKSVLDSSAWQCVNVQQEQCQVSMEEGSPSYKICKHVTTQGNTSDTCLIMITHAFPALPWSGYMELNKFTCVFLWYIWPSLTNADTFQEQVDMNVWH